MNFKGLIDNVPAKLEHPVETKSPKSIFLRSKSLTCQSCPLPARSLIESPVKKTDLVTTVGANEVISKCVKARTLFSRDSPP